MSTATLKKESIELGLATPSEVSSIVIMHGGAQADMVQGEGEESSTAGSAGSRKTDTRIGLSF